jgi:hypothetical protein
MHPPGTRVAWVRDERGPVLAVLPSIGPLRFWDVLTFGRPEPVRELATPGGRIRHLVLAPDGSIACAFSLGSVLIASPEDTEPITARLNCDLTDLAVLPHDR